MEATSSQGMSVIEGILTLTTIRDHDSVWKAKTGRMKAGKRKESQWSFKTQWCKGKVGSTARVNIVSDGKEGPSLA